MGKISTKNILIVNFLNMLNNSVEVWQEFSEKIDVNDLIENIDNLPKFQIELSKYINSYYWKWKKVLEVWCEFWLTSFSLNDWFDKYLLDFDWKALEKSEKIFKHFWKKGNFIHKDMFNMDFDFKFDIIFNAGVLEHFNFDERKKLLKKYSSFLKDDWIIIIAIPNHYNFFYRLAYKILIFTGKWSFPKEEKIYDMKKEIEWSSLTLLKRDTVDIENIYTIWWKIWKIIKIFFWSFIKEWYLTILTIKK